MIVEQVTTEIIAVRGTFIVSTLLGKVWRRSLGATPSTILALLAALKCAYGEHTNRFCRFCCILNGSRPGVAVSCSEPGFSSIVVAMMLVMEQSGQFSPQLVIKSRWFDHNHDTSSTLTKPGRCWIQGREYKSLKEADNAVRLEMLNGSRLRASANLAFLITSRSWTRPCSRCAVVAGTSPARRPRFPSSHFVSHWPAVLQSVGVDGPQQLLDFTAPPVDLRYLYRK